jgi:DNA polymerase V
VCVGIASTPTLAKLANRVSKKRAEFNGVCLWSDQPLQWQDALLARLPVIEIWGIAARLTKRLELLGIRSIADLKAANPVMIRDRFNVVVMRTVLELRGTRCIPFEEERLGKDMLIFSRSFSTPLTTGSALRQVMSVYAQRAAARLEKHQQRAKVISAFAATSFFSPGISSYPSMTVPLPAPTTDPVVLARAAHLLLSQIVEGTKYVRAGIQLTDLSPVNGQQALEPFRYRHEDQRVSSLIETVAGRFGRESVGLGYAGFRPGPAWQMKREMLSLRAATHWNELAIAKA